MTTTFQPPASHPVSPAPPPPRDDAPAVVLALNALLRSRRLLLGVAVLLPLATGVAGLLRPRTYTSVATVAPTSGTGRGEGSLAGLAAQFGVSVPGTDASQSPAFYADLVKSHDLLGDLASAEYDVRGRKQRLEDVIAPNEPDTAQRREATITWLREHGVHVEVAPRTGVLTIQVTAGEPMLAKEMTDRLLAQLAHFNVTTRQSRASAERAFTEQRLADARSELRGAEDMLQDFYQRNRGGLSAPSLSFEEQRLERAVQFRQQIVTSLAQSYEQARIDQVRDTPVFTVIDRPSFPTRPDRRGLVVRTAYALIAGTLLGLVLALGLDALSPRRGADDPMEEFASLRREFARDLRRPWRLFLARGGRA